MTTKVTFKQYVADSEGEKIATAAAKQLLGTGRIKWASSLNPKLTGGARHVHHKFVDTVNGPWNLKLMQTDGDHYVEVNPPRGSNHRTKYIVPDTEPVTEDEIFESARLDEESREHRNVIGHIYNSRDFTYSPRTKTFSAEISSVPKVLKQLWNDSADEGFGITSAKSNDVVLFTLHAAHKDSEGDVTHWTFSVYNPSRNPKLDGLSVTVFND